MKYLKQFIIGSSYLVFAPHFYAVQNSQVKTYGYYEYTMLAPIWLGMWNVISLILAEHFKLTMRKRFLLVSVLASISIMIIATFFKTYDLSPTEWLKYYIMIFLKYLFIWNVIVYNIEKNI
jgi:hypothetical protein